MWFRCHIKENAFSCACLLENLSSIWIFIFIADYLCLTSCRSPEILGMVPGGEYLRRLPWIWPLAPPPTPSPSAVSADHRPSMTPLWLCWRVLASPMETSTCSKDRYSVGMVGNVISFLSYFSFCGKTLFKLKKKKSKYAHTYLGKSYEILQVYLEKRNWINRIKWGIGD